MKMYISNLGFHVTGEDLRSLFQAFGAVLSAEIIFDRAGHSRRFGFVSMSSEQDARSAMEKLNGEELEGRYMFVGIARPSDYSRSGVA